MSTGRQRHLLLSKHLDLVPDHVYASALPKAEVSTGIATLLELLSVYDSIVPACLWRPSECWQVGGMHQKRKEAKDNVVRQLYLKKFAVACTIENHQLYKLAHSGNRSKLQRAPTGHQMH